MYPLHSLTSSRTPDLHRLIIARRGDAGAIERPRHRSHKFGMPVVGEDVATIGCIPGLHHLITARRSDALIMGSYMKYLGII